MIVSSLEVSYDLIVTGVTMHHVADVEKVVRAFHDLLRPGGKLCIADWDTEPVIFHSSEAASGVYHYGSDRERLKGLLAEAGFTTMHDATAHTIHKPVEGNGERSFPVFLITANR